MHGLILAFFIILLILFTIASVMFITARFIAACTIEYLKKRYIRGEISHEEFLQKKNDLNC